MITGFFDVPWLVWAGLAAVLAAVFTVLQVPEQAKHTLGITHLALRWFHSLAWLLLALSFVLRGLADAPPALSDLVGLTGLGTYVAFHVALRRTHASKLTTTEPRPGSLVRPKRGERARRADTT